MAKSNPAPDRPLSPNLTAHRLEINAVMSFAHRVTGGALYAMVEQQFAYLNTLFGVSLC